MRGDTPARTADRARARESLAQRGIEAPATSNLEARQRVQSADRERAQQSLQQHGIGQSGSARERAQVADRQLKNDAQARERAQASLQDRQRAQASLQDRQRTQASLQNRQQKQPAHNQQVRQQVRQQHAGAKAPRNNALAGVRDPAPSRVASNRGQVSQQSLKRPSAASAGHQVQRPVRTQSHGGGRRR
ncbi:hypothetical protein D3C79_723230 [compost metagenome]